MGWTWWAKEGLARRSSMTRVWWIYHGLLLVKGGSLTYCLGAHAAITRPPLQMAKASGCLKTEEQLRRVHSKCHIFGHTHINTQQDLSGAAPDGKPYACTYMQNAMGYGIRPGTKLTVVHDSGHFKSYNA